MYFKKKRLVYFLLLANNKNRIDKTLGKTV